MNEENIRCNSLKAWVLAARPKTLTAASVPVLVGLGYTAMVQDYRISWIPAILCMLFAFVMQIDANFVNDYFDWRRGNDDEATRLGPLRACSQGWVTPKAMIIALMLTTVLSCLIGLPLVYYGGWEMILVGVACVAFCILYTTCLSYMGLGDVLVFLFFGIVPTCFTFYLQTGYVDLEVFFLSLLVGMVIDNLLIVNNYRDIDNDRRDGKKTLIVRLGKKGGESLYLWFSQLAGWLVIIDWDFDWTSFLIMIYVFLQTKAHRQLCTLQGRALNKVLGMTARNIFIYGILLTGILLLQNV